MKQKWTHSHSDDLYHISRWGSPYFSVNKSGDLVFQDPDQPASSISLMRIVRECSERGLSTPVLIRFDNILDHRLNALRRAFSQAQETLDYAGEYRPAMPIKVNQQRHVIETLLRTENGDAPLILEVGSKPELIAGVSLMSSIPNPSKRLICNGYKDRAYIELAALAQAAGIHTTVVIDRYEEIHHFIARQKKGRPSPHIGLRIKLSSRGSGRWEASSGDESKFGLTLTQLEKAVRQLKDAGLNQHIHLIHYHIGSQITTIRAIREAAREAFHVFVGLKNEGLSNLCEVDIGGGLAVDYDGSGAHQAHSRNYSLEEYAKEVLSIAKEICSAHGVEEPTIITESGRSLVAHHSVLVFDVLSADPLKHKHPEEPAASSDGLLHDLWGLLEEVDVADPQSTMNRARDTISEARLAFSRGHLSLKALTHALRISEALERRLLLANEDDLNQASEDLLMVRQRETYYCNFSLFQSLPDMWAVDQLFPIVPIHRLDEEPTRHARLVDLTCDSDGAISQFINAGAPLDALPVHQLNDQPYYIGAFLVGAYQETLGDLHNLFGDTHVVHVNVTGENSYFVTSLVRGDRVDQVLSYVEYDAEDLVESVRAALEDKATSGELSFSEARRMLTSYEESLRAYTYLEGDE